MTLTPALTAFLITTMAASAVASERRAPPLASGIEAPRDCGANGFALPGSAGCVRLAGAVAVTTTIRTGGAAFAAPARTAGPFSSRVQGRLAADIRLPTDLGPIQIYAAIRVADPRGLGGFGHAP